jgi:hypothetical protein
MIHPIIDFMFKSVWEQLYTKVLSVIENSVIGLTKITKRLRTLSVIETSITGINRLLSLKRLLSTASSLKVSFSKTTTAYYHLIINRISRILHRVDI